MRVGCHGCRDLHRLQQYLEALEPADLPEEGKPVPRPVLGRLGEARLRDPAVLLEPDLLARDAPVDEALEQEPARRQELVDV
jgi:hypothetical protein